MLFNKNKEEFAELKSQNLDLKALQSAVDQFLAAIEFSPDGTIIKANTNFLATMGYGPGELAGKHHRIFCDKSFSESSDYTQFWQNLANGEAFSNKIKRIRKDGSVIWLDASYNPVADASGRITRVIKLARDITAEVNNSEFIGQTLEQALDAVVSIDEQNNVSLFNKAAETLWGYRREEVIGKNVKMLVPVEFQTNHDEFVNANRRTGVDKIVGTNREVEVFRKDGTKTWGSLSLSKININGKITYTAFVKDISEEKGQRDFINQVLEQAIDGVVSINANNEITFFNKAAEELWGYKREEVIGKNVKMLVPADLQGNHDKLVNANRTTGVDKIVGTSREVPVYRKDGSLEWGNLALSKIYIGDEIHYTAFVKNVTEDVKRRGEFARLSLVANETDNSVIITNNKGEIEYINPGFTKMTGYELADCVGKKPGSFLQGKDTDQNTVRRIREKLDAREPFYDEILNYHKAGESYWISLAINPVFNKEGELERFISIQANVTQTKLKALEFNYKLEAISRANAVAEFNLKGELDEANENYLAIFGANEARQLLGKPLDKLFHPNFVGSKLHKDFWNQLHSGQFVSAEFLHQTLDKKECWISGSFNPIFDTSGNITKYVMYGEDATGRKSGIQEVAETLSELEQGNLLARAKGDFGEELNTVRDSLNTSMDRLQETMLNILEVANNVGVGAGEISKGNVELSGRVESQAASLEETASTMEELTESAKNNADNASSVNDQANETGKSAQDGLQVVNRAVASMQEISASSKKIADIISVIDEIAFQTNLLALNAAVEAARAGEQGRGFAVVAGEVRNLAQRSAQAAKEIGSLIKDSVGKVEEGTELVTTSGETLQNIAQSVLEVTRMVTEIADASRSQLEGIQQANSAVSDMDGITQQNAALVEEITSASAEMTSSVERMRRDLQFFRAS